MRILCFQKTTSRCVVKHGRGQTFVVRHLKLLAVLLALVVAALSAILSGAQVTKKIESATAGVNRLVNPTAPNGARFSSDRATVESLPLTMPGALSFSTASQSVNEGAGTATFRPTPLNL